jgi:sugar phosphate isomerase/epimerase
LEGLQLAYHNHAFEFEQVDGKTGFRWLQDETDPEAVKFEVDTYWVHEGGGDPAAFIRGLGRRCAMVHLKDRARDGGFGEVGSGTLNFPAIFEAAQSAGVDALIVEQDSCPRDPFDCIATGLA